MASHFMSSVKKLRVVNSYAQLTFSYHEVKNSSPWQDAAPIKGCCSQLNELTRIPHRHVPRTVD